MYVHWCTKMTWSKNTCSLWHLYPIRWLTNCCRRQIDSSLRDKFFGWSAFICQLNKCMAWHEVAFRAVGWRTLLRWHLLSGMRFPGDTRVTGPNRLFPLISCHLPPTHDIYENNLKLFGIACDSRYRFTWFITHEITHLTHLNRENTTNLLISFDIRCHILIKPRFISILKSFEVRNNL